MTLTKEQLEHMAAELDASFDAHTISEEEHNRKMGYINLYLEILNNEDSANL